MSNPILVTGADGMLGRAVLSHAHTCYPNGNVVGFTRAELDITNEPQINFVLGQYTRPTVINCAGIVKGRWRRPVGRERMIAVNTHGPQVLAIHAHRLIHVSTDCVFSGDITDGAYSESSKPDATDPYGITKLRGEITFPPHLTVRASFVGLGQRGLLKWLFSQPQGARIDGYTNVYWNGMTAKAMGHILMAYSLDPAFTGLMHVPGPVVMSKHVLISQVAMLMRPDLQITPVEVEPQRMVLASDVGARSVMPWSAMMEELQDDYRNDPRWA